MKTPELPGASSAAEVPATNDALIAVTTGMAAAKAGAPSGASPTLRRAGTSGPPLTAGSVPATADSLQALPRLLPSCRAALVSCPSSRESLRFPGGLLSFRRLSARRRFFGRFSLPFFRLRPPFPFGPFPPLDFGAAVVCDALKSISLCLSLSRCLAVFCLAPRALGRPSLDHLLRTGPAWLLPFPAQRLSRGCRSGGCSVGEVCDKGKWRKLGKKRMSENPPESAALLVQLWLGAVLGPQGST